MREANSILGGNIELACKNFKDLLLDPLKWHSKYKFLIWSKEIKLPDYPSAWAWVFEIPLNWFSDNSELGRQMKEIIGDSIYGEYPSESYTMQFATLLFRRF
jgi:hypothetical protein